MGRQRTIIKTKKNGTKGRRARLTMKKKEKTYHVEAILATRSMANGEPEYLVKWGGYKASENTWEPIESFRDGCDRILEQFHEDVGWENINEPRPTDLEYWASDELITEEREYFKRHWGHEVKQIDEGNVIHVRSPTPGIFEHGVEQDMNVPLYDSDRGEPDDDDSDDEGTSQRKEQAQAAGPSISRRSFTPDHPQHPWNQRPRVRGTILEGIQNPSLMATKSKIYDRIYAMNNSSMTLTDLNARATPAPANQLQTPPMSQSPTPGPSNSENSWLGPIAEEDEQMVF